MNEGQRPTIEPAETIKVPEMLQEAMTFQAGIRDEVRTQLLKQSSTELSEVIGHREGDFTYKIDSHAEEKIQGFAEKIAQSHPLTIIAEGFGRKDFGIGNPEYEIIIDPIDGTRGIMYDMRSAWVLTGIAKKRTDGKPCTLDDIEMACMTEIPTTKQDRVSVLWSVKGQGAVEDIWDLRENRFVGRKALKTSGADTLKHGFATFVDFFPGCSREVADIKENVYEKVIGPVEEGKALVFDDQYISNAGQMYELITGKYRFVADLRPELEKALNARGKKLGLAAKPYDLSTSLIAQEAGAIITDAKGGNLSYPLDTSTNCTWIGYANSQLRSKIEPVLMEELAKIEKTS